MRSMIRQGRVVQLFGLGLLIAAAIVFVTGGPSYAAVSASVSPNTGLHDTQTVHVQGSGLPANTTIAVLECTRGALSSAQCEGQTLDILKQSDASGNYDNPDYTVFVLPDSVFPTVSITCDATHACDLFVGVDQNDFSQPHAFAPIEFADAAPSPSPTPTPTHSPTPSPTPTPTHSPSATPTPSTRASASASPSPTPATGSSGGSGGGGSTTAVQGEQFTTLPRTGAPTGALFLAVAGMLAMIGGSISRRLALRNG